MAGRLPMMWVASVLFSLQLEGHWGRIQPAAARGSVRSEAARLEAAARWAVRSAIPDGIDDWPAFRDMRLHPWPLLASQTAVVACGTLEFADPSAGRTHFVVVLASDAREGDEPLSAPVFFGPLRAAGAVPIAALCDEPGPSAALAASP